METTERTDTIAGVPRWAAPWAATWVALPHACAHARAPHGSVLPRGLLLCAAALLLASAVVGASAAASCTPLIDALERARAQPRVAQFLVDDDGHPTGPEPVTLRIGDVIYENFDGRNYARRAASTADPLATALRAAEQRGTAACESVGTDKLEGKEVTRWRFGHPDVDALNNPVTVLISRTTGLPLFHFYTATGQRGFVWIYGDAVRAPVSTMAKD